MTKPSPQGVAVRPPKRHAFVVDQREWDYGARLPRERRAADSWSLDNGPESTESGSNPPKWQSITDTGSLEPSAEALAWAKRADQWAQQPPNLPERRQQGQSDGQVSRWSEVVPTGTFPADGVGWRTETAEWRATSARWRQTTEWRSTSGTHGWRSTTEAWQTGDGDAEGFPPAPAPPTGGPLAISNSAWSSDATADPSTSTPEGWQQSDGSYRTESYTPPSAAGQPAVDGRPSWQSAAPAPPWQQAAPAPPWQQAAPSPPPWEQQAPAGGAPWQQFPGTDDGRHLVREDDRAQWRQSAAGGAGVVGRRRAPDGDGPRSGGGTGWSARSESDNWAGHTDTGSMQMFPDPAVADGAGWPGRAETPSWRADGRAETAAPDWRTRGETPSWRAESDAPARRTDGDAPDWRTQTGTSSWRDAPARDTPAGRAGNNPAAIGWRAEGNPATPPAPGWRTESDGWRTESGPAAPAPGWRTESDPGARGEAPGWRTGNDPATRGDVPAWRAESDAPARETPTWRTGGDAATRGEAPTWRTGDDPAARAEAPTWRTENDAAPRGEAPTWRADGGAATRDAPTWRTGNDAAPRGEAPRSDAPRGEAPTWRTESAGADPVRRADADAPDWRAQPEPPRRRGQEVARQWPQSDAPQPRTGREDNDVPGRRARRDDAADVADWRTQTSASSWRTDARPEPDQRDWRAEPEAPGWRAEPRADGRASTEAPDWRQDRDDYRREPDSGAWSRGEEPRSDSWRRAPDPEAPSWGREQEDWRREEPAADPWAHTAADTGVFPASWQQPSTDTDSWRTPAAEPYSPPRRGEIEPYQRDERDTYGRRPEIDPYGRRAEIEAGPYAPTRRRAEIEGPDDDYYDDEDEDEDDDPRAGGPIDPEVWRQDPEPRSERRNWRMEPLDDARTQSWRRELVDGPELPNGDAPTEIRPAVDWQQAERGEAARGSASYREANTGDWRRELAAESGLADGESRRYGTADFVPFQAPGQAADGTAVLPAPRPALEPRVAELSGVGTGRWQDPPDTQWPPRPATGYDSVSSTGSYERRPVSTLPTASVRQNNLLEPDEDEIEESTGGPLAAVGYTVIWYGVPVVLFVLYMLVLNGTQQAHALSTLANAAPQFGLSLVLSMLVAVGLRWASGSWKAASVGLAAAVVGGGLATVLTSAVTGNSLS